MKDKERIKTELARFARAEKDLPLRKYTGFQTGGNAELAVFPGTEAEMVSVLCFLRQNGVRFYVMGGGMNLLAPDGGYDGVIVSTREMTGIERAGTGRLCCLAGTPLSELCLFAEREALGGLEFAAGIPGTAGGAVFMNAGAYGGEMKDAAETVSILDRDGEIRTLAAAECGFGYRMSRFQKNRDEVILSASFLLSDGDAAEIRRTMDGYRRRRAEKQPLNYPSCGSAFRRPKGAYASKLIEECGLKGKTAGGAAVSEKHAGFIINRGGAASADVLRLMEEVAAAVFQRTGYRLEPEIEILE